MDDEHSPASLTAAAFHRQPGTEPWRVTATGPQAVFTAPSTARGAALIDAIVTASTRWNVLPDVDLRPEAVVVVVPYRTPDAIPDGAAGFAADVSTAAASLGLVPDPALIQSVNLYVAEHSTADDRPFFVAALGYEPFDEGDAVDPLRRGPQLAFNPIRDDRPGRGRTHIDVSVPADQAEARVAAAIAAGGRLVDDAYAPAWWTLASPDNHGVDIAAWPDNAD